MLTPIFDMTVTAGEQCDAETFLRVDPETDGHSYMSVLMTGPGQHGRWFTSAALHADVLSARKASRAWQSVTLTLYIPVGYTRIEGFVEIHDQTSGAWYGDAATVNRKITVPVRLDTPALL